MQSAWRALPTEADLTMLGLNNSKETGKFDKEIKFVKGETEGGSEPAGRELQRKRKSRQKHRVQRTRSHDQRKDQTYQRRPHRHWQAASRSDRRDPGKQNRPSHRPG